MKVFAYSLSRAMKHAPFPIFMVLLFSLVIHPLPVLSKEYKDTRCLRSSFKFHREIAVDRSGLEKALGSVKAGEFNKADEAIIDYFLRVKGDFRLESWGFCEDAVTKADLILNDQYKFGLFDQVEMPRDILWSQNSADSRSWIFYLFSFDFLQYLNSAYRETGNDKYLQRAREIILDFQTDCTNPSKLPDPLSWYDHTVANRAGYMLDFWRLLRASRGLDRKFTRLFVELLWRHAKFLELEENYNPSSNHGLFAASALYRISVAFPEFKEAPAWKELALKRMERQIQDNFTPAGIHKEYSPYYQFVVASALWQFQKDCRHYETPLSQYFRRTVKGSFECLPWLLHPDGTIALFGDSDDEPNEGIMKLAYIYSPFLRYVDSDGRRGRRPRKKSRIFFDAALFVMRSGWGENRPLHQETCLMAYFTEKARSHEQQDFLTFELYARGQKWITDLGRWAYEYSNPEREFIVSAAAHNVIVPYWRMENKKAETNKKSEPGENRIIRKPDDPSPAAVVDIPILSRIERISLENREKVHNLIASIGRLEDPEEMISAYHALLAKNPVEFEDQIKISLAFVYGETLGEKALAVDLLEEIIEKGPENRSYPIARDLLASFNREIELKPDSARGTESGEGEPAPVIPEEKKEEAKTPPAASGIRFPLKQKAGATDEGEAGTGDAPTPAGREIKEPDPPSPQPFVELHPLMLDQPEVFGYRSAPQYDYVEGEIVFNKYFVHKRAILFIKPYYFLILDRVTIKVPAITRQLFHAPPSVSIAECEKGFQLQADDSSRCLIYSVVRPPGMKSAIIKGRKGNKGEWQGWYSGTLNHFEEAPVLENSIQLDKSDYYSGTLFIPIGRDSPEEYRVKIINDSGWNPADDKSLLLEIVEPGFRSRVSYRPSPRFLSPSGRKDFKPDIRVQRRRR
ncbi:MAG: heparinase II/III family protein [Candidatus Krumholzibacteriota bacterium]|nr:heparinase II/III family protein [Candidatus Krumholzibacteriota bacterium]